jgi:hypothetical protein
MHCESCGKQIPDDSKFCEFCGTAVKAKAVVKPSIQEEHVEKSVRKPAKTKPKSKLKLFPILLIAILGVGVYFAVNTLGTDDLISKLANLPNIIFGRDRVLGEPVREDFDWYVPMSYDDIPQGGTALDYNDILGAWKLMVINGQAIPEETFFSTAVLSEYASEFNTKVELTHHFVEYDGEHYPFEGDEAKDLLYANYSNRYLTLALSDDRIAEIIFWKKDGHEYGQSHIYSDWDNDGIEDLVNVVLFTR